MKNLIVRASLILLSFIALSITVSAQVPGSMAGTPGTSATGAFTYSIPIALPPGIKGVVPQMAIVYNSQAGNGLLGYGWDLAGISSIGRIPTDIYHDGSVDPVNFNSNDIFTLDGARLVKTGANDYESSIKNFAKITSSGSWGAGAGPYTFQVEIADGLVYEYLYQVFVPGPSIFSAEIYRWNIKKVHDRNGNYMDFYYTSSPSTGEVLLSQIKYTGNSSSTPSPTPTSTEINFIYSARSDPNFSFVGGGKVQANSRLDRIEIKQSGTGTLVHAYDLEYPVIPDFYSHLISVKETGEGGTSLPKTTFTYGNIAPDYSESTTTVNYDPGFAPCVADFNGDGVSDFINIRIVNSSSPVSLPLSLPSPYYKMYKNDHADDFSYVTGGTLPSALSPDYFDFPNIQNGYSTVKTIDFDGDGKEDLLTISYNSNDYAIYLSKANAAGTGFSAPVALLNWTYTTPVPGGYGALFQRYKLAIGDFLGNGKKQVLLFKPLSSTAVGMSLAYFTYLVDESCIQTGTFTGEVEHFSTIDFDGDGKDELYTTFVYGFSEIYTPQVTYSAPGIPAIVGMLTLNLSYIGASPTHYDKTFFGDFNGDGKGDILTWEPILPGMSGMPGQWFINYANGANTFDKQSIASVGLMLDDPSISSTDHNFIVADYNGDGKDDIFEMYISGPGNMCKVHYSRGNNDFVTESVYPGVYSIDDRTFTVGDFNGDGQADLLNFEVTGAPTSPYKLFFFHKDEQRHFLRRIDKNDNLVPADGQQISVSYAPLPLVTGPLGTPPAYPFTQIISGRIKAVTAYSNNRTPLTVSFWYNGLVGHKTGLGLRGFDRVHTYEPYSASYQQNDLYSYETVVPVEAGVSRGISLATVMFLPNLSKKLFTYNEDVLPNNIHVVYPVSETSEDYVNNLTSTTTYSYYPSLGSLHNYGKPDKITTNLGYGTEISEQEFTYNVSDPQFFNQDNPAVVTVTNTRTGALAYTRTTSYTYDPQGRLSSQITDPGTAHEHTATYTYDAFGNVITQGSAAPPTAFFSVGTAYSPDGRFAIQSTKPSGHIESATYDVWGNVLTITDVNGQTSTNTYDDFSRLTGSSVPSGPSSVVTSNITYNWANALSDCPTGILALAVEKSVSGISGSSTDFYDYTGKVLRNVHAGFGGAAIYTDADYNADGSLHTQSMPYYPAGTPLYTTYYYDMLGRQTSEVSPTKTVNTTYTAVTSGPGPMSGISVTATNTTASPVRVTQSTTDASGKPTSVTDGGISTVSYQYASNGKQIATNANGHITSYTYDAYGNLIQEDVPNKGTTTYVYDARDRLASKADANGITLVYSYDVFDRVLTKTDGTPACSFVYNYGTSIPNLGKLVSATGPAVGSSTTYSYDALSRPQSQTETINGNSFTTSYTYDAYNREATTTYPGAPYVGAPGYTTTNEYNVFGDLVGIWAMGFASSPYYAHTPIWRKDSENALGQTTHTSLGIDASVVISVATTLSMPMMPMLYQDSSVFNTHGFLTSSAFTNPLGTVLKGQGYVFDEPTGNLLTRSDAIAGLTETFTYDNLDRLISATPTPSVYTPQSFIYTPDGNMKQKSDISDLDWTYVHYAVVGIPDATTFTSAVIPTFSQTATYTSFDKVAELTENNRRIEFLYKPDEQRGMARYYNGATLTRTRYYAENFERTQNVGSPVQDISYIMAEGRPVAMFVKNGAVTQLKYIATDYLGSIAAVLNDLGGPDEFKNYDAWGRMRDPYSGAYPGSPLSALYDRGYTAQENLKDFNVINLNGRLYDPLIGRMFSVDPYITDPSNAQTYNSYSYANNNPMKYTDPSGEIAGTAAFFALAIGTDYLSNVICGWDHPGQRAYGNATSAVNGINNAMRVSIIDNKTTNASIGLSPLNLGVSLNASYNSGNFSASGSAGVGLFGGFGSAGAKYKLGDLNLGVSGGVDGGGALTLSGALGYKGVTAGLSHYGGDDAQWNWLAGYQKGDFSFMTTNDVKLGGDKFRTAAAEIGVGPASVGFNIYTTDHSPQIDGKGEDIVYRSKIWGSNPKNTYKSGSRIFAKAYFGYNDGFTRSRFGYDGPEIQDFFQDGLHRLPGFHAPYFNTNYGPDGRIFGETLGINPYSLY